MDGKDLCIFIYKFIKLISSAIACNTMRKSIFFFANIYLLLVLGSIYQIGYEEILLYAL